MTPKTVVVDKKWKREFDSVKTNGKKPAAKKVKVSKANGTKPIIATRSTTKQAPRIDSIGQAVLAVTPAMAEGWLSDKLPNRNLKDADIDRYARDMQAGAWHLNGEAMIFAGNEAAVRSGGPGAGLLDGQQRAWAIVTANVTVRTAVCWGVPQESMESIDTGVKRTFGDLLAIKGKTFSALTAGAARWLVWHDMSQDTHIAGAASIRPTHHELMEAVERHPEVEEASRLVGNSRARVLVSPSMLAFALTVAREKGYGERAKAFLDALANGMDDGWGDTSPVYHLYTKMQANRASKLRKIPPIIVAAYTMKALNAYIHNQPIRSLKWNHLGDKPEAFPVIV